MAASKKDATKTNVNEQTGEFDWSGFLPEGYSADQLQQIGGLTPIFMPEMAYEEGAVCVGFVKWIEELPPVTRGRGSNEEVYVPYLLRIQVTRDTPAVIGPKNAREIVTVPKGEDVLVPLSTGLLMNKKLLEAAHDLEFCFFVAMRVKGQIPTDQPSPLWDWDVRIDRTKPLKRQGDLILPTILARPALPAKGKTETAPQGATA
jgi:hypothetical protein